MTQSVIVCINCNEPGTKGNPLILDGENPIRHQECPPTRNQGDVIFCNHPALMEKLDEGFAQALDNIRSSGIVEGFKYAVYFYIKTCCSIDICGYI